MRGGKRRDRRRRGETRIDEVGEKVGGVKRGVMTAGPATMTSRAEVQGEDGVGTVEKEHGGTCHNDKPGLESGKKTRKKKRGEMGRRQPGRKSKAGPATMASRALVGKSGTGKEGRRRW